jgi:glyoxylate reductase
MQTLGDYAGAMAKIVVTRELAGDAVGRLAAEHEVVVWPETLPPPRDWLLAEVTEAEGLLAMLTDKVDAELIAAAPRLKVVCNYAVGVDNVDLGAAAARGIAVGRTPDVLTDATADLAMALLLAVARRLPEAATDAREGRWPTWEPQGWLGVELRGATLLVVGPGRIGSAVAERAAGFGMRVRSVGRDDDLHAALATADFVSLHAPLTEASHHLIDAEALAAMKETAILVNTGRGGLVDQVALRHALVEGQVAGAGLDVTDPEPLPPEDPLFAAPNLIVLPHIGSATHTAREAMAERAVANLEAGLSGRELPFPAPL